MKLTYRGHAYELATPSQTDAVAEPGKVKLIYRGQTYDAPPCWSIARAAVAAGSKVTLIYRGATYQQVIQTTMTPITVKKLHLSWSDRDSCWM